MEIMNDNQHLLRVLCQICSSISWNKLTADDVFDHIYLLIYIRHIIRSDD